jgi:glycosyltransferase involved in cell wall biosynthesis
MKLFHVSTVSLTWGFLKNQIGYMQSQGFEVHAVSSPGKELDDLAKSGQVPTHEITMLRRISPARDLVSLIRLFLLFRREKPNVVHAHTPKGGLLAMIAAWMARVPCRIFHIHGLPHSTVTGFARMALKWSTKVSCVLATRVLSVSRSASDLAVAEGLCAAGRVLVPGAGSISGIDAEGVFSPLPRRERQKSQLFGYLESDRIIGFVGRLARDKGILELHRSWAEIREKFDSAYLVIAGEPDERDPAPSEVLQSFRSDKRVRMLGWVTDTSAVYSCLDVLVLPSYREGLPTVILEAAAMEVPAIAARSTGCIDAVVDGVTGLLVETGDHRGLTEALERYLSDESLRREHGRQARARVLQEFKPEDVWQATLQN